MYEKAEASYETAEAAFEKASLDEKALLSDTRGGGFRAPAAAY